MLKNPMKFSSSLIDCSKKTSSHISENSGKLMQITKHDRRTFIGATSRFLSMACVPHLCLSLIPAIAKEKDINSPAITREEWMEEAISMKSLKGRLEFSRFVEPMYFLLSPTIWKPNTEQRNVLKEVTVPKGFVTDLASIPRVFYSLLRPDREYAHAAIVHDFLYWKQTISREDADKILKFAMEDLEVDPLIVKSIYQAVKMFGGSSWENNAKLRLAGEKRILRKFPNDPTTRWVDWKKKSDVFSDI